MKICGKMIRTTDNNLKPCQCEIGHKGGCNPFSANPFNVFEKPKPDYRLRAGDFKCPWNSPEGSCILRVGHFPEVSHKIREEKNNERFI